MPAAPATVLRLRDATVTLRRAKRGYRGLLASVLRTFHGSSFEKNYFEFIVRRAMTPINPSPEPSNHMAAGSGTAA